MGSPLSPCHHCRFDYGRFKMQNFEIFGTKVSFYFRYVDDIATAILNHLIEEFLEVFNSFYSRLRFTLKVGYETG